MMRTILILAMFAISVAAQTVTVAVAANVSYAVEDLVKAFEKGHPATHVRVILGSSGKLTAQIRRGAPFDLFLSADTGYPEALHADGVGLQKPRVYARGLLALLSPKPRELDPGLRTLLSPQISRIAVANPKTAPYGRAAVAAMKKAGLYRQVLPRLIYGESVSQTLTYTLRAADVGIVAKSALMSPKMRRFKEGKNWVEVDRGLYRPIAQGMLLLSPNGRAFYDFLTSEEARKIFEAYGYLKP
jgi:molybdate transport system substrate-binding protein